MQSLIHFSLFLTLISFLSCSAFPSCRYSNRNILRLQMRNQDAKYNPSYLSIIWENNHSQHLVLQQASTDKLRDSKLYKQFKRQRECFHWDKTQHGFYLYPGLYLLKTESKTIAQKSWWMLLTMNSEHLVGHRWGMLIWQLCYSVSACR